MLTSGLTSAQPRRVPTPPPPHHQRQAERRRQVLVGEHVVEQPGRHHLPRAQQQAVGVAGRDLLDVVGDQHRAGASASCASADSRASRSSRPPRSSPAAGSSSSSSSGSVISARAISTRLRSPSDSVPKAPAGEPAQPERVEQLVGAARVGVVVALAPAPDHRVPGADDDVADVSSAGTRRPSAADDRPIRVRSSNTSTRPSRSPSISTTPRSGAVRRRPAAAASSCPRRSGRGRPSARRAPRPSRRRRATWCHRGGRRPLHPDHESLGSEIGGLTPGGKQRLGRRSGCGHGPYPGRSCPSSRWVPMSIRDGVRFAVASTSAEAVEVCLVDGVRTRLTERRVALTERTFGVWHGHVPGVGAGPALRLPGARPVPAVGRACAPTRPRSSSTRTPGRSPARSPTSRRPAAGRRPDDRPAQHGRLARARAALGGHRRAARGRRGPGPDVPWAETVIAELHVARLHPAAPGRAARAARHLPRARPSRRRRAPAAHRGDGRRAAAGHRDRRRAAAAGPRRRATTGATRRSASSPRTPATRACPGAEVEEFRAMVDALHAAGIEVILDIVPNHTCEGGVDGTTLSFRGLDAPAYYCLRGTATTPTSPAPATPSTPDRRPSCGWSATRMRNWVTAFGVDGFRIDLASVLGRPRSGPFDPHAALLTAIATDPVLSRVQADRRAVGRHRRGLPGRRLRGRVVGVERPLPRRRPRLLARPRRRSASWPPG